LPDERVEPDVLFEPLLEPPLEPLLGAAARGAEPALRPAPGDTDRGALGGADERTDVTGALRPTDGAAGTAGPLTGRVSALPRTVCASGARTPSRSRTRADALPSTTVERSLRGDGGSALGGGAELFGGAAGGSLRTWVRGCDSPLPRVEGTVERGVRGSVSGGLVVRLPGADRTVVPEVPVEPDGGALITR